MLLETSESVRFGNPDIYANGPTFDHDLDTHEIETLKYHQAFNGDFVKECIKRPAEHTGNASPVDEPQALGRSGLKKYRRLTGWQGHWVQCDACHSWRKVTAAEQHAYQEHAFVCHMIGVHCKR